MKADYAMDSSETADINRSLEAESKMELLRDVISGIRNVRGEMNLPPSLSLEVLIQSDDKATRETLNRHRNLIVNMARLNSLTIQNTGEKPKSSATAVISNAMIFVSLEGIIDFTKETKRLEKEVNKLASELTTVAQKLENRGFLSNAPADVIDKVKEKHKLLIEKQDKLQANLDIIKQANDSPA